MALASLMLDCALGGSPGDLRAFHRTNLVLHVITCLCTAGLAMLLLGRPDSGGAAPGRPDSSGAAPGRPDSGGAAPGRPDSGRPDSNRPASDRPICDRPVSGAQAFGRPLLARPRFPRPWPAALAAMLFGFHPLMVEPLAWLGQRKALLAGTFTAVCLLAYVLFVQSPGRRRWVFLAVSLLAYAAGMLSKPSAVPAVALILLLDVWPLRRISRRTLLEKAPFVALAAAGAALALVSHAATAEVRLTETGLGEKFVVMAHKLGFYLGKLVWPADLSSYYPPPDPLSLSNGDVLLGVVTAAGVLGAVVISLRWTRAAGVCALMFLAALAPVLGGIGYSWIYAFDNYLYIPLFAVVIAVAFVLDRVLHPPAPATPGVASSPAAAAAPPSAASTPKAASPPRSQSGSSGSFTRRRAIALTIVLAVAAAESVATRRYLARWKDTDTLHTYMVSLAPDHARPRFVRAYYLARNGHPAEAIDEYRAAAALDPALPGAQANLGQVLLEAGRWDEAIPALEAAAEQTPDVPARHFALGNAYARAGHLEPAAAAFERTLSLDAHHRAAMENLGRAYWMLGRVTDATATWERRLAEGPAAADVYEMLGDALIRLDRPAEGVARLVQAMRSGRPRLELANRVAWILATHVQDAVRDGAEALNIARQLNRATGGRDPRVLDTLAAALAENGFFTEAVQAAEHALAAAGAGGDDALADAISLRLEAYRARRAWRTDERPNATPDDGEAAPAQSPQTPQPPE
ncbi:MAG: tetratricopeptide repeat protein [Phycisphaerales bacterium]|nr:MAG: tetratricopeptide repeat protein [Phycisphaerales bacterium]